VLRLCSDSVSTESSERAAVRTRADRFLDDLLGWLAIPSIGSQLRLLHRGAEAAAHLWWLLGALRS
jgi:hypothetical protein